MVGVWFEQDRHYPAFERNLRELKESIFGVRGAEVVLHRKEILQRKGAFGRLRDASLASRFDEGWLKIVSGARYRCTAVTIDKQAHLVAYRTPFHPYHYALAALLDRYCGWLRGIKAIGDVVAETRSREDRRLQEEYERIRRDGSLQFGPVWHEPVLTSNSIKFQGKSANSAGLQLADSLAYPLRQWALTAKGLVPDPGEVFGKRVVRACAPRLHRSPATGRIAGYGHVWLPKDRIGPEIEWPVQ